MFNSSRLITLMVFILLFVGKEATAQSELDSLLVLLENAMEHRSEFDVKKIDRMHKLKRLLADSTLKPAKLYAVNNRIVEEYIAYNFDSTLMYLSRNLNIAKQIGNLNYIFESYILQAEILAASGRYKEALDVLGTVNRAELSEELLSDYYLAYYKVYGELRFYAQVENTSKLYNDTYKSYTDSLMHLLEPDTERFLAIKESQLMDERKLEDCLKINSQRLAMAESGSRLYSMVTFLRALNYDLSKNVELQKKFLILSAISDIKASVKDNASLTILAMILFREHDIQRAYKYINFALQDAVFFNSRLRFGEISNILPLITAAYEAESLKQKAKLRRSLVVISLLTIILLLALVYIYRQVQRISTAKNQLQEVNLQLNSLNSELSQANAKLNGMNDALSEANHVKEHYIGNFLNICSDYIEKLDNYRKMVHKMIVGRKVNELFETTKSLQIIDKELKEFYDTFDNTFLHIYPHFVAQLNDLLLDDEKVYPKKDELLTTELRIFALIRLGIVDSSEIAKLLRYSVNTIYNYRAKMKSRAAGPREDFETAIMKIGSHSS